MEVDMSKNYYDIHDIMKLLPHRYPFLLVDRVMEVNEKGGWGYKNVSMNEEFFQGHFPGQPIMPGVLIIEGMAQCAGFIGLTLLKQEADKKGEVYKDKLILFMGVNNAKFRKPVLPGDRLEYHVEIIKFGGRIGKFQGYAKVDGEVVAEAEMMAMITDREVQ
jgi:3-hydroxyacyl-[acyl-carrier-protein] dehydratase